MDLTSFRDNDLLAIAVVASASAAFIVWRWTQTRSMKRLPPGPPLEPIFGGARAMPPDSQWKTFAEWSKTWGASSLTR